MKEHPVSNTTKNIAYVLLIFYGLFLSTTLVAAICFNDKPAADKWLSTFKDGLAFLGGALATIIGYYFGNRNTDVAFEKARVEEAKAKESDEKAKQEEAKKEVLKTQILDAVRKDDSSVTDISPLVSESILTPPKKEV